MPNIATILKAEITRLARKEVRGATEPLKKAVAAYRTEIAALKKRADSLERELTRLRRDAIESASAAVANTASGAQAGAVASCTTRRSAASAAR